MFRRSCQCLLFFTTEAEPVQNQKTKIVDWHGAVNKAHVMSICRCFMYSFIVCLLFSGFNVKSLLSNASRAVL